MYGVQAGQRGHTVHQHTSMVFEGEMLRTSGLSVSSQSNSSRAFPITPVSAAVGVSAKGVTHRQVANPRD